MENRFDFGVRFTETVKKENVGGIILDIDALQSDGTTVCNIADLNDCSIDLTIVKKGANDVTIFSGYLGELLAALYTQTPKYDVYTKKYASGYKIKIGFGAFPLLLRGDTALKIECDFDTTAFALLDASKSSVAIETLPTSFSTNHGLVPLIQSIAVKAGTVNIDEDLGDSITSVVLATDFSATYDASTNAKPTKLDLYSMDFDKSISENALIIENLEMLSVNPDSDMRNLVVYRSSQKMLNEVKLKTKLTSGAAEGTRILVTKLQQA